MNTDVDRIETYQVGEDTFSKEYLKDGQVRFRRNDTLLSLRSWNWEINRFQSMKLKEDHPNPLVRWIEYHRRRGFLDLVDARRGEFVADVGAEGGYLAAELVRRGCKVTCLDIDPSLLVKAREYIGPNSTWCVASDIRQLGIPSSAFDVTIASEILEHVPDPLEGLNELLRITRSGGKVFLSVPNDRLVLSIKRSLRVFRLTTSLGQLSQNIAIGHLHVFDKNDLRDLCSRANVAIESMYYHKPFCLNLFAQLRKT
jgi:2-polyprenyl-3-methyl-5-hydroxy-6-metoxy-1,4-benzoquinol methylase